MKKGSLSFIEYSRTIYQDFYPPWCWSSNKKHSVIIMHLRTISVPSPAKFPDIETDLVSKHDGGWRIIYHLSAQLYISINYFIDPKDYSLSYCTIDDAYDFINQVGPDLQDAFRHIPVHPSQWNLLGICWKTRSEVIHWTLVSKYGVCHLLHYLDDFLTTGPLDSPICSYNLATVVSALMLLQDRRSSHLHYFSWNTFRHHSYGSQHYP